MEISMVSDTISTVASQVLSFSKFNVSTHHGFTAAASNHQVSAVAPPPVRSVKTIPRRVAKKKRRTKRRSSIGGDEGWSGEGEETWFFGDGGDYVDGGYGGGGWGRGGGGGGGGKGWNFDGFGGSNWEESSSFSDPAFDFVYEILSWIVLSNCLHFAYKKVVRIVADGFGDPARDKIPIRLTPIVC